MSTNGSSRAPLGCSLPRSKAPLTGSSIRADHPPAPSMAAATARPKFWRLAMKDEVFNLSVRKFLKSFGLHAQHEIEQSVANALARHAISGQEKLPGSI